MHVLSVIKWKRSRSIWPRHPSNSRRCFQHWKKAQCSPDVKPFQENSAPHLSRDGKNRRKGSSANRASFHSETESTHTPLSTYAPGSAPCLFLTPSLLSGCFHVFQIDKQQFEETVRTLNNLYAEAEKLGSQSYIEGCMACLTAYTIFLCMETHYEKVRHRSWVMSHESWFMCSHTQKNYFTDFQFNLNQSVSWPQTTAEWILEAASERLRSTKLALGLKYDLTERRLPLKVKHLLVGEVLF